MRRVALPVAEWWLLPATVGAGIFVLWTFSHVSCRREPLPPSVLGVPDEGAYIERRPADALKYETDWQTWQRSCLEDIFAGRHAIGCCCEMGQEVWSCDSTYTDLGQPTLLNACRTIAAAALDGRPYRVRAVPNLVPWWNSPRDEPGSTGHRE